MIGAWLHGARKEPDTSIVLHLALHREIAQAGKKYISRSDKVVTPEVDFIKRLMRVLYTPCLADDREAR